MEGNFQNFTMDEAARLSYLDAMGITCWVPKDEWGDETIQQVPAFQIRAEVKREQEPELPIQEQIEQIKQVLTNTELETSPEPKPSSEPKLEDNNDVASNGTNAESVSNQQIKNISKETDEQVTKEVAKQEINAKQYLKIVNWSNQTIKDEGAKTLLIICRHQIDQPAGSFARSNSPSQFMSDYLRTIIALNESNSYEIKIKLAHLSEAGLSSSSIKLDDLLESDKPDGILVLGDETISQLTGETTDVSVQRGRLVTLSNSNKALVSYHPYSLIENPSLKSLALEDILGVVKFLNQEA